MVDETNVENSTDLTPEVVTDIETNPTDQVTDETNLDDSEPEGTTNNGVTETNNDSNDETNPDDESPEDDSDDDVAFWKNRTRKARNEAKNLRDRLRDAESKLAERDETQLQAQVDSLMNELRTERLANHLTPKVQAAGAIDPEILIGLVHLDSVEWKDNAPLNVDTIIDDLKGKYPKQFKAANGNGNVGTRNEPKGKLEGMTSQELLSEAYS